MFTLVTFTQFYKRRLGLRWLSCRSWLGSNYSTCQCIAWTLPGAVIRVLSREAAPVVILHMYQAISREMRTVD